MTTIFWDPAAAQVCLASLKFGKEFLTEVSTCLVIVPANKHAEINPDVLEGKLKSPTLSRDFNCLRVVAAFVPQQEGTSIESIFTMEAAKEGFDKYVTKSFPFLNQAFVRGWVHNHPSGVNPSAADERTFKGYLDAGSAYHLMVIYDPSFGTDKTVIYNKLYINTDIIVPDTQPAPQNSQGVTHVVMHNNSIVLKNPFIESYCSTQMDHVGLLPQAWRSSDFDLYSKLVTREKYEWPEIALCVNEYGEDFLTLPSKEDYKKLVRIRAGFHHTKEVDIRDKRSDSKKKPYSPNYWSTFENI